MKPLNVAIVGAGYFSDYHLAAWKNIAGARLVAICDIEADKARKQAATFEIPSFFDSVEIMLERIRPDLVDVITPPQARLSVVKACAEYRVPMICQKPLADRYEDSVRIVEVAEATKTPLVIHENFRFLPWFREAKRLISIGFLGQLHAVTFRLRPGDGQGSSAYLERQPYFRDMPQFLIHETGIHFIDTFRYMMGEVAAVTARLRKVNPAIVGEDAGYVIFDFVSGSTGLFDGNRLNDHPSKYRRRTMGEMWLEGSEGVLRLDGDARLWWQPHHGHEQLHQYDAGSDTFTDACTALQRHVVDHFSSGSPLENTGRDYLRVAQIEAAVYRSHEEGRRIELPI